MLSLRYFQKEEVLCLERYIMGMLYQEKCLTTLHSTTQLIKPYITAGYDMLTFMTIITTLLMFKEKKAYNSKRFPTKVNHIRVPAYEIWRHMVIRC